MSSLQEQTQVLYEIAIDVGGSMNLQAMLKRSMRTMLSKLDCFGGAVFADRRDGERYRPTEVFSLPRNVLENATYAPALSNLRTNGKPGTGRTNWPNPEAHAAGNAHYYLFDLSGFGVLVLLTASPLAPPLARALRPICNKLAESCIACENVAALAENRDNLREAEELQRNVLNNTSSVIYIKDLEGRFLFTNRMFEKLFPPPGEETAGRTDHDIFPSERADSFRLNDLQVIEAGKTLEFEETARQDDGEHTYISAKFPLKKSSGEIFAVCGISTDITERKRVQKELSESRRMLSDVLNTIPVRVFWKDLDGVFLGCNQLFARDAGRTEPSDLIGDNDYHMAWAEQAELYRKDDEQIMSTGRPKINYEEPQTTPEGKTIWLNTSKIPLRDRDGNVYGVLGTYDDITERKQVEETLRESENRLQEAQQLARLGYWIWNVNSGAVEWSDEVYRIFRLDPDAFTPRIDSIMALSPWPDTRDRHKELIQRAIRSREPGSFELRFLRPDGSMGYYASTFRGVYDNDGRLSAITGTVQDITERKEAEENLRRLRNYLRNIIDSMPSVLIGVDSEGAVTQWNREAQRITGVCARDALGQPLAQTFPRLSAETQRVRNAIQTRQEQTDPKRVYRHNGEVRYEDVTIYPLTADAVEGAVIRIDDVTERVRIEEMMIQSEKMLSVGGLAAGMAHEINNPLGGIMQTAAVMVERLTGELPANHKAAEASGTSMEAIRSFMEKRSIPRMLDAIRESGQRAAAIVDNMLGFARKGDTGISCCNPADLLDQTIQLAGTDYDLKKRYDFKQIEIVREYENDLPLIPCEPQKIQQVLLNVLKNGAQAMQEVSSKEQSDRQPSERKRQRLLLRLMHEQEANMIRMEITDNGPGMDATTRKRVFEPFFTSKPPGAGTGLGLSVSYFIITENHGGTMSVESQPGTGSTFIIRLPLTKRHL